MPKRILKLWISALLMLSSAQLFAAELFFDRQNKSWTKAGNAVSDEAYRGETQNGVPHGTEFRMGPVQVLYPMEPYLWGFSKMVSQMAWGF